MFSAIKTLLALIGSPLGIFLGVPFLLVGILACANLAWHRIKGDAVKAQVIVSVAVFLLLFTSYLLMLVKWNALLMSVSVP